MQKSVIINLLVLVLLAITWGSSFILMKKGLTVFSNYQIAFYRVFSAGLFLLPFALYHFKKVKIKNISAILIVGVIGNFIPAFLFTTAQVHINSSLSGMLNSLTPLFTLLIGVWVFNASAQFDKKLGVGIGLIGALGLVFTGNQGFSINLVNVYVLLPVVATICYATSVNTIKYYLQETPSIIITSTAFFLTLPISTIGIWKTNFIGTVLYNKQAVWPLIYITILGVLGTAIAVLLFNWLIKRTSAVTASSVTYLIPIVAIYWGLVDGEVITKWQFVFMAIVLIGVYLVNKPKRKVKKINNQVFV